MAVKTAIIGYGYMGEIRRKVIEVMPELELTMICEPDTNKLNSEKYCKVR